MARQNKNLKNDADGRCRTLEKKGHPTSLPTRSQSRGAVRIVGGIYKRTPLTVGNRPGLRPTPERVRETVFDWLNHLLGGLAGITCCDMFAGSGALGFEAASRGAQRVVSIELDRRGCMGLRALVEKLGAQDVVEVVQADALSWLRTSEELFDVIFIDPPFAADLFKPAAAVALKRLKPQGLVYLESDRNFGEEELAAMRLVTVRSGKAGAVFYRLTTRADAEQQ